MPDDKLIPPVRPAGTGPLVPAETGDLQPFLPPMHDEEEEQGLDLGRYLFALLRHKWLLMAALVLGLAGAAMGWRSGHVEYTATGNLWVQVARRPTGPGDVAPIRPGALLASGAWIELLRSYAVLDSVVIQQRLYLRTGPQYRRVFSSFDLADQFQPGDYRLTISDDGKGYSLGTKEGAFIERGRLGDPIGADLGFRWTPNPRAFPAGAQVEFTVVPPRDASHGISGRLSTAIDRDGNFIALRLRGGNPQEIASTLNAIMERHVALAAALTKGKLDAQLSILQDQLRYAQQELEQAQQDLEEFRVTTITLPSDNATPIAPGLQSTTGTAFSNFFQMRVTLDQTERDRRQLQAILDSLPGQHVRIEALQAIQSAASSLELQQLLTELVDARSQLRALRDKYADEYPPIQDQLTRIRTIEQEAVPRVVSGIVAQLGRQASDLIARVDSASTELRAIPPRTIEEARRRGRVGIQESIYNMLRQRVETARLASASSIPDVDILDRATVPRRPTDDNRLQLAGVIFMGIFGAAVGLVLLLELFDPRVRYPVQVSREIGLDILGSIPRIENGSGPKGERNAAQVLEAFRELRLTIGFAHGSAGPLVLVITSPSQGEGKSLIATNLAVAFAEMGRRTLLVDGDTRRGDAHRLLGRERAPGLTDYLRERSTEDIIQSTEYERLHFIGSGTRSGTTPELLASPRMAAFLGTLKRAYEVIILDSPPLAAGGDAVLLAALTGNMALVIRTGSTDKPLTVAKLQPLSRLPIRILGAILNDVEPKGAYYRHYYSYLPGYEPTAEIEGEEGEEARSLLAE